MNVTGRTHDLAAFTALVLVATALPSLPSMSYATLILAFGANFVGGLFPDIDQKTSDFWDNFRLGPFVAKVVCPFLGGHRNVSHSLVGLVLIGSLAHFSLQLLVKLVNLEIDPSVVWWAFMIGVVSHIIMDLPTKAGVPFLWPMDWKFGIPPFRALRMESGKFVEKWVVFPGLLALTAWTLFSHYQSVLTFFKQGLH